MVGSSFRAQSNKLPSVRQQGVFLTHADVATGAEGAGQGESAWPETLPTNELLAEDSWPKTLTDLCLYPLQPGEALLELECGLFFGLTTMPVVANPDSTRWLGLHAPESPAACQSGQVTNTPLSLDTSDTGSY